ncbi:Uncharacterized protein PBTT_00188 [Plasmodiophora brassicae]
MPSKCDIILNSPAPRTLVRKRPHASTVDATVAGLAGPSTTSSAASTEEEGVQELLVKVLQRLDNQATALQPIQNEQMSQRRLVTSMHKTYIANWTVPKDVISSIHQLVDDQMMDPLRAKYMINPTQLGVTLASRGQCQLNNEIASTKHMLDKVAKVIADLQCHSRHELKQKVVGSTKKNHGDSATAAPQIIQVVQLLVDGLPEACPFVTVSP